MDELLVSNEITIDRSPPSSHSVLSCNSDGELLLLTMAFIVIIKCLKVEKKCINNYHEEVFFTFLVFMLLSAMHDIQQLEK